MAESPDSLEKLNMELPRHPPSAFLGMRPRDMKTYVQTKKKCTQVFITALFLTAKYWKPNVLSRWNG